MVDELKEPKAEAVEAFSLDTTYRCDRCAAQAYTEATLASGLVLYFCKHHGDLLTPSLGIAGARLRTDYILMKGLQG